MLQIDPKDVEARYQLAETLSKQGDVQNAVAQYLAVIKEDPKHLMSRLRMGQIYLLVKQPDETEKLIAQIQAIDPENIEGMVLSASFQAFKNNTDAALSQLQVALKKQPDEVTANLLLASLNVRLGKLDQAIAILQHNSEKNPTNPGPLAMLSRLYADAKDVDKTRETLQAIIKIEPQKLDHRKSLAVYLATNNLLDDAEAVLRSAINELPEDEQAKLLLIDFLVSKRKPEVAIAELLPMIGQYPDKYDLRFKLAELELVQNQVDQAVETLKEIVALDKQGPQSLKARNKLAKLYVGTQRVEEAKALVKNILEENPRDAEALALRGEFALAERRIADAIGDFRAVLVDQPQNIKALKLLSAAHLLNNDPVLARENMEKAVEIAPNDESARLDLANLLQQSGKSERAFEQVSAVLKTNPNSKLGLEAAFKHYLSQKQWNNAQDSAKRMQEAFADEGMGYYLSGIAYQAEGKLDNSVTAFANALSKQPESVEPLTQLTKSFLALKQSGKAVVKLNEIIKQQPNNFVAYNLLGGVYLADNKFAEAMSAYSKAKALKPEWPNPYRNMALIYLAQSKKSEAIKTFQEGIANSKDSMELINDLVSLYQGAGEHDKAIAVYEDVYKRHPDSLDVLNNLTSYISDHVSDSTQLERAAKLAEPLIKANNPYMLDTAGWIAYKQGGYARAQELLLKAVELDPNSAISNYHLGMSYYQQKDNAKAREYLQKAVATKANFIGLDAAQETLKSIDAASHI
ncbi:tetratricopeptide repeat protein [Methylomicrobium lacus]|uniref:tetratricopeptide repeat protein n=1 Tax=Methylomicrobium lacus TaxID=136992 RepID=UPI0035A901CF